MVKLVLGLLLAASIAAGLSACVPPGPGAGPVVREQPRLAG